MKVISINVGNPEDFNYDGVEVRTAIYKNSIGRAEVELTSEVLEGDDQADKVHHGGPDKAICVYPHEHYSHWNSILDQTLPLGAFGENFTTEGLLETEVYLGDIFSFGEAVLQVTQPRQPCHKLAKRYNYKSLPLDVMETGYTGFYMRVLKPGKLKVDLPFTRIEMHPKRVSIAECNRILFHDKYDRKGIENILAVDEIAQSLRLSLEKRVNEKE